MKKNNFTNNRDDRWYLNIMSPNTKGGKFAWLDPTSIYINTEAVSYTHLTLPTSVTV